MSPIAKWEAALTSPNPTSFNPLADLILTAKEARIPAETSKAIYATYRVFATLISAGKLSADGDENAKLVKAWLIERLNDYTAFLIGLLSDDEEALRTSALQILFSLLKYLSTSASRERPEFHISHFRKIVSGLILCPPSTRPTDSGSRKRKSSIPTQPGPDRFEDHILQPSVLSQFATSHLNKHDDIRWFFCREAATLIQKQSTTPHAIHNLFSILHSLTSFPVSQADIKSFWVSELATKPPRPQKSLEVEEPEEEEEEEDLVDEDDDDWRKFFDEPKDMESSKSKAVKGRLHTLSLHAHLHSLPSHRAVFSNCWLRFLPLLTNPSKSSPAQAGNIPMVIKVLSIMHRLILPHLTRPVLVMDWVAGCVEYGGTPGLLALNALFILMTQYNLDYPSFYNHFPSFLTPSLLHSKYRARFFRMFEIFLSSTLLPTHIISPLLIRLSELSLHAPPAAILTLIPFTYNLMKKHPKLMEIIHASGGDTMGESEDVEALKQIHTLLTHRAHYLSSIQSLSKIYEEAFTRQEYGMEDFLDLSYSTLLETDFKRKIKKEPALAFVAPGTEKAVGKDLFHTETGGDVITELWSFA